MGNTLPGVIAWLMLCLLMFGAPAAADDVAEFRKQVVGTMLLTGTLAIAADGSVIGYAINQPDKVPPEVLRHLARHVPRWKVTMADASSPGEATERRFSVRVMAIPEESGYFRLSLAGANIVQQHKPGEDIVADGRLRRPEYPRAVLRLADVSGTVYVAVKVGRDGKVADLVIEQVNLNFIGEEQEIAQVRAEFAAHTAAAARQWKFKMPKGGPLAEYPFLEARVPVTYIVGAAPGYGEWEYYLPGPRRAVSGAEDDGVTIAAGESGELQLIGVGPRLVTPLEPPAG
ncbi:hypothetical protein [Pseudoxanthomonas wuyuanensis]|nr:hypothetical protein [Pseudoxanthomonas wuyuanensis]